MKLIWRLLGLVVVLLIAAAAYVAITYEEPQFTELSSFELAQQDDRLQLQLDTRISNRNRFPIPMDALDGELRIGDISFGQFRTMAPVRLPPRDTGDAKLAVDVQPEELALYYAQWITRDSAMVTVDGTARLKLLVARVNVPFEYSVEVPLRHILAASIDKQLAVSHKVHNIKMKKVGLDSTKLNAAIEVFNPFPFDIKLAASNLEVFVGGNRIGVVRTSGEHNISANGSLTMDQEVEVNSIQSVLSLGAMLLGARAQVKGVSTIRAFGNEFAVPIDQQPELLK